MKKKAIEKIPFLTLKKVSRKKSAEYIGVTAIKNIGHERHLLVEVYENREEKKDVPIVRIALTKKDFGIYITESKEWTRKNITGDEYGENPIWEELKEYRTREEKKKRYSLQSPEDLDRIQKFCKNIVIWDKEEWWKLLSYYERRIISEERRKRESRKYERRQQALYDRMAHTPELPERLILDRADKTLFRNKHYLYYKKRGSYAQVSCSKCGGVYDGRWKEGQTYESQFESHIEEPREGYYGTCKLCGIRGMYKCQGKVKGTYDEIKHIFLGQRYKENGFVMRYIEVSKGYVLEQIAGEKDAEMHGAYEEISGTEIARAYFEQGKKTQIDFHKHNPYTGKDFWDDCNLDGMRNITIREAPVMQETFTELKGTIFQYSALGEYATKAGKMDPIMYLERYQQTPQIEVLVKMNMIGIVKDLINCRFGIVADAEAKRPDEFLGIRKERVKQLMRNEGDTDMLVTMQMEKRCGQHWTDEQIENLKETGLSRSQIETATRFMGIQKLLNRIEKYAGCSYGSGRTCTEKNIRNTARTYIDYLQMRLGRGYDLNNAVYQHPRDLEEAHRKMVEETNKEEMDRRLREVEKKFPKIRENYRKLRKKYYYEDDTYIIRPARSAEEIVKEGRILHHCVGGNNYLDKHNRGLTYILMLRFRKSKDTPYITVEIEADRVRMCQWYGEKDTKPDKENIDAWLKNYLQMLRNGTLAETMEKAEQKVAQEAMMAATA